MNSVERVKEICKDRKIPISKLEKDLGFSNGYISQLRKGVFPADRLTQIASYLDVTPDFIMTGSNQPGYYLNEHTAAIAQEIFENRELRALFDVQCDMEPEELKALHNMALALKRKERGYDDDTGC